MQKKASRPYKITHPHRGFYKLKYAGSVGHASCVPLHSKAAVTLLAYRYKMYVCAVFLLMGPSVTIPPDNSQV